MRPCQPGEPEDLILDGFPKTFDRYEDAVEIRNRLIHHAGARWPDWLATKARLQGEYDAEQALRAALKPTRRAKRERKL